MYNFIREDLIGFKKQLGLKLNKITTAQGCDARKA
jgi:hypothetical protein